MFASAIHKIILSKKFKMGATGAVFSALVIRQSSTNRFSTGCDATLTGGAPRLQPIISTVIKKQTSHVVEKTRVVIRHIQKVFEYVQRLFIYALLGVPVVCIGSTAYVLGGVAPIIEDVVWDYCIWSIQMLGPTFIKLAQWASTRPDLYPPAVIKRLESMQDNVRVNYSMESVERTLKQAFGDDWTDLRIERKPIGAGCVAQVFKGSLIDKKTKIEQQVAIKLIHPHVEKMIKTDMELLALFASFIDRFPSLEILSLGDTCREYSNMMNKQLDLRIEASNLSQFASNFSDDPWAAFPLPVEGWITRNVLVETLIEGSSIVNFMKMKPHDMNDGVTKLKLKLSDLGCRSVIKMIFFDNLIHGDMHPGNILVQFNSKGDPRLVFLDAGIVYSSKTEEDYKNLVEICFSLMKHDGYKAGRLLIDSSKNSNIAGADAFCNGVQKIIDDSEDDAYFEHIGEYVSQICNLAREHSVRLSPAYFQIAMSLKVMEGVTLSLNKDLELVSKCVPLIVKAKALRAVGITKFPSPDEY